jgi:excinuclease ABC subunit C
MSTPVLYEALDTAALAEKALVKSELDDIPGVGPALKRKLLNHFGSARGVRNAALEDLANAPGIGPTVAKKIHDHFHPGG